MSSVFSRFQSISGCQVAQLIKTKSRHLPWPRVLWQSVRIGRGYLWLHIYLSVHPYYKNTLFVYHQTSIKIINKMWVLKSGIDLVGGCWDDFATVRFQLFFILFLLSFYGFGLICWVVNILITKTRLYHYTSIIKSGLTWPCEFSNRRDDVATVRFQFLFLFKGFGYFLYETKHKCPQIYIRLTWFKDSDGGKIPLKYNLLKCCSF